MTKLREAIVDWWRDNHGGWGASVEEAEKLVFLGDAEGDPLDAAILGLTDDGRLVYHANKAIDILHEQAGGEWSDAVDFFMYNVVGTCQNAGMPVIMWPFEPETMEAEEPESDTDVETAVA